jgi:hypothetical protein
LSYKSAFAYSLQAPRKLIMSFRLSAYIIADHNGRISVKFYVADFYKNLSKPPTFG